MKKKTKIKIFVSLLLLYLLGANFALAQEIKYPALPGDVETPQEFLAKIQWCKEICQKDPTSQTCQDCQKEYPPESAFSLYIKYFYHLFLWIAGPVLLIVLIWGGIQYFTAGDSPVRKDEAKSRIFAGFLGILLLFFSYLILTIISPQFTILRLTEFKETKEWPEITPPKIEYAFSYVELPAENSIKNILCNETICGEVQIPTTDLRSYIHCGEIFERCQCKKVRIIKIIIENNIITIEEDEEGKPIIEKRERCLLDAIGYVSNAFDIQFKIVNEALRKIAKNVKDEAKKCQCENAYPNSNSNCLPGQDCPYEEPTPICDFPYLIIGCDPREECFCRECAGEPFSDCDVCPNRGKPTNSGQELSDYPQETLNYYRKELWDYIKKPDPEYKKLKQITEQLERLKCLLYRELFKLEKIDLALRDCSLQIEVVQPMSQPELRNYMLESQRMGAAKTRIKKFYEWLDIEKLKSDLATSTKIITLDIRKPENREKIYRVWRDLRSYVLATPDSPVDFYCPKTNEFSNLHKNIEILAYARMLGISESELAGLSEDDFWKKVLNLLTIIGSLNIQNFLDVAECKPIPTSEFGVFPPEELEDFASWLQKNPPEDTEAKVSEFQETIEDIIDKITGFVDFIKNLIGKIFSFFYNINGQVLAQTKEEMRITCEREIPSGEAIGETKGFSKEILKNINALIGFYMAQEKATKRIVELTGQDGFDPVLGKETPKDDKEHCTPKRCQNGCELDSYLVTTEATCRLIPSPHKDCTVDTTDTYTYSYSGCYPDQDALAQCESLCPGEGKCCLEYEGENCVVCGDCTEVCSPTATVLIQSCKVPPCSGDPCPFKKIKRNYNFIKNVYQNEQPNWWDRLWDTLKDLWNWILGKEVEEEEKIPDVKTGTENISNLINTQYRWPKEEKVIYQNSTEVNYDWLSPRTWQKENWENLKIADALLLTTEIAGGELENCFVTTGMIETGAPFKWLINCQTALEEEVLPETGLAPGETGWEYTPRGKCYYYPNNYFCCR